MIRAAAAFTPFYGKLAARCRTSALAGGFSSARGINKAGQVVGRAWTTKGGHDHAFLWQAGKGMQDLGAIGGESNQANGINNAGQVVGGPNDKNSKHPAFLYSGGKMIDLNSMIDPTSGWHLTTAAAINDSGQIAGSGMNKAGQSHAVPLDACSVVGSVPLAACRPPSPHGRIETKRGPYDGYSVRSQRPSAAVARGLRAAGGSPHPFPRGLGQTRF